MLLLIDATFVVMHLLSCIRGGAGETIVRRHEFLDLGAELSIATWWQQAQLLTAAALCGCVHVVARGSECAGRRHHWAWLAGIFVYVSVDEATGLHEGFTEPMQNLLGIESGWFTYAWVVPAAGVLTVFAITFFRFWRRLPPAVRSLSAIGGSLFVAGGLGFEIAGAAYNGGVESNVSELLVTLEEGLEMLGASIFVFSVLQMLRSLQSGVGTPLLIEE